MTAFDDLLNSETVTSVRRRMVEYAEAAELAITNFADGGTALQVIATFTTALFTESGTISSTIRGFASLDTSTDPGDEDAYDPDNVDLEPEPGFLSNKGANEFGTPRREETFATGFVTFDNTAGLVARTFGPEALTFTWTGGSPPTPAPTYRNSEDDSIYVDPGPLVTVPAGGTLVIPVEAEERGTRSNAGTGELSMTTVLSGATATNAAPIVGSGREPRQSYIERCRRAPARVSLAAPYGAYEYFAQTNLDGTPLLNASGAPVNISRVQVSQESSTGIVDAFYASPSGSATAEDVTAANNNIEVEAFAVPDAITFTGAAAVEVLIAVAGTAKLKSGSGVTTDAAKDAIVADLTEAFSAYDIGGVDQVDGAGVIYTRDLEAIAACSYPGLYDVQVTIPAAESTALAMGEVATLSTSVGDWSVVLV